MLLVRSLLEGFENLDSMQEIHARLDDLMHELDCLYDAMLGKMSRVYRKHAARLFIIFATAGGESMPALLFSVAEAYEIVGLLRMIHPNLSAAVQPSIKTEDANNCNTFKHRLLSRCCGLLELYQNSESSIAALWHRPGAVRNIDQFQPRGAPRFDIYIGMLPSS